MARHQYTTNIVRRYRSCQARNALTSPNIVTTLFGEAKDQLSVFNRLGENDPSKWAKKGKHALG
ncbi:MAG TPA: hypothetical protein VHM88_02135, partial [Candidatus Acidoferrales bacterium]|nr:hypothetical protein [Candidatus Acidoferrales bacterium]